MARLNKDEMARLLERFLADSLDWLFNNRIPPHVVLMGAPEGTWAFNPRAQSLARALEDFSLSELWDAGFLYTHVPGEQWQQECKELSLGGTDAL